MSRRRVVVALIALAAFALPASADAKPPVVAFGNSFVSDPAGWSGMAAAALGRPLVNRAEAGSQSRDTLRQVQQTPAVQGSKVVIQCGLNDLRFGLSAQRYAVNLARMLKRLAREPVQVVVVLDVSIAQWAAYAPYDRGTDRRLASYNRAASRVARRYGVMVANPRVGWNARTMVADDGVHPNALGAQHIAAAVTRALAS